MSFQNFLEPHKKLISSACAYYVRTFPDMRMPNIEQFANATRKCSGVQYMLYGIHVIIGKTCPALYTCNMSV